MILAWRHGDSIGRYVLVDSTFPWPALHHGRAALKVWATAEGLRRQHLRDEGPCRAPFQWNGLTTAVVEYGDVLLRVWPVDGFGLPRQWTDGDGVWRQHLHDMRRFVSSELKCCSRLEIMPGGEVIRSANAPSLAGINGFRGWKKGEREPIRRLARAA